MKKLLILTLLILACSSNSNDGDPNQDGVVTLKVNNVYLENPSNSSWVDVIVTDGTYTQSPDDDIFYADEKTTYIIHFLELQLNGDFSTPNVFEQLYDSDNDIYDNQGTEGIIFYINIKVENGKYVSSTDLTETEGYVKFTVHSENNFSFYIEMIDGTKYQGSYNGPVHILDQEYGFEPDVYWTG